MMTMDDKRIADFTREFPETTHRAAQFLCALLEDAEAKGRRATTEEREAEIQERIESAVKQKTEKLVEYLRVDDSMFGLAKQLARYVERFEEARALANQVAR